MRTNNHMESDLQRTFNTKFFNDSLRSWCIDKTDDTKHGLELRRARQELTNQISNALSLRRYTYVFPVSGLTNINQMTSRLLRTFRVLLKAFEGVNDQVDPTEWLKAMKHYTERETIAALEELEVPSLLEVPELGNILFLLGKGITDTVLMPLSGAIGYLADSDFEAAVTGLVSEYFHFFLRLIDVLYYSCANTDDIDALLTKFANLIGENY